MHYMVIGASVFILISLALAWLATAVRIMQIPTLKQRFPSGDHIVKGHIDFLLMALLLMGFFLLARAYDITYPAWAVWFMIVGGFTNSFTFIIVAMHVPENFKPGPLFAVGTTASFVITTLGFGAASVMLLLAELS